MCELCPEGTCILSRVNSPVVDSVSGIGSDQDTAVTECQRVSKFSGTGCDENR